MSRTRKDGFRASVKDLKIGCILDVDNVDVYEVTIPLKKGENFADGSEVILQ